MNVINLRLRRLKFIFAQRENHEQFRAFFLAPSTIHFVHSLRKKNQFIKFSYNKLETKKDS